MAKRILLYQPQAGFGASAVELDETQCVLPRRTPSPAGPGRSGRWFSLLLIETLKWLMYFEKERKLHNLLGHKLYSPACPGAGLKGAAVLS